MNILALSAHTDDAELGAGGFLARAIEQGDSVTVVAFSMGNPETGANWQEFRRSTLALGIEISIQTNCYLDRTTAAMRNYETRRFHEARQYILDALIALRCEDKPDLVLCPSTQDIHQDHQVIAAEAMRAFRTSSILGYELPWCNYEFKPTMYVPLIAEQMEKKQAALACYESQQAKHYFDRCVIDGLARMRGMQVKAEFAEAFEVIRWVMK